MILIYQAATGVIIVGGPAETTADVHPFRLAVYPPHLRYE